MSDVENTQLPDSAGEVNLTEQEQQDIRSRINQVAQESQIRVTDDIFVPSEARRGVGLSIGVAGAVIVAVAVGLIVLFAVFQRGEALNRAEAGQYVSIEGRLIRALRQESQEELGTKNLEIETIRSRLKELEEQQEALEADIADRIAQREEEIRLQLEADIRAERARLIAAGTGNEQLALLMAQFEAERRAFYERRLEEFKQQLEVERSELQANIDQLRAQYQTRLEELQRDRERIVEQYKQREAELRLQLQRRTEVVASGGTSDQLEAAGTELFALSQQAEEAQAVENHVVGQIDRIRASLSQGDIEVALPQVRSLQSYLTDEVPLIAGSVADRRDTDLFLLGQLEAMLESRLGLDQGGGESGLSLIQELSLLRRLRQLATSADGRLSAEAQAALTSEIVSTFAQLNFAQGVLEDLLFRAEREGYESQVARQEKTLTDQEVALSNYRTSLEQSERALAALDEQSRAAERELREKNAEVRALQQQIMEFELANEAARRDATRAELEDALLLAQADLKESQTARDQSGAAQAELESRVAQLSIYEGQVREAKQRYDGYIQAVAAARRTNPTAEDTAARQELNEFLKSREVRDLFGNLATDVETLFSATQTAGSSAALADAADIVTDIANQPSQTARLNMLRFEKGQAEDNPELLAILTAMESALESTP